MSLSGVEAIHVATVLEDCVDQLAILGRIMPVSYQERPDADQMVEDEITELVDTQRSLEHKYETVMDAKSAIKGDSKSTRDRRTAASREVNRAGADLNNSTYVVSRGLKQNPLTPDNLVKVQKDRAFVQHVLLGTLREMSGAGSYQTLVEAVRKEKEKKARLQDTILREEQGRKRLKQLQSELSNVKKEKEVEVQQRNELIAHYKDQLQEMKAKTNMEGKYIKKSCDVSVAQTQKRCNMDEATLRDNIEKIRLRIEDETSCNMQIETYLRMHTDRLQKSVEYWMEKYDVDVEAKQKELDILKASKAKDLERLQSLTKTYGEYEQVVVEDRIEKEKLRRKDEQEAEELRASIRLQSWWRGVMVRKGLGPYSKKKKKKGGKKGKSGKKKK